MRSFHIVEKKKIEASPRFLNNNLDTILYYLECTIFILEPKGILASLFLGGFMERFGNNTVK
ncbi:hypothetical protein JPSP43_12890 [Staphylococcus pseudintermedius]